MPTISVDPKHERYGFTSTNVMVDGKTIALITDLTDPAAVARFVALCELHVDKLAQLKTAYDAAVERNIKLNETTGKGRYWPEFGRYERFKASLLKTAGIIDS